MDIAKEMCEQLQTIPEVSKNVNQFLLAIIRQLTPTEKLDVTVDWLKLYIYAFVSF